MCIRDRLYYVIFQWSDYRDHPIDALKIWEGGLADVYKRQS